MAPVPFTHPVRYSPLILAAGHISSIAYFAYAVGDSLYTSYKSLGPGASTRSRINQRRRFVPLFLGLAIAAFFSAMTTTVKFATLSYDTWAYEHGLDMTQRLLGEDKIHLLDDNKSRPPYIVQWLSDTPIYTDALEIVAETSRRFWWGQQIDLGIAAFGLMLATEGRRRKIPLLTAFLVLAHLVNLSFAQNLFFIALLLTPFPLPEGDGDLRLPVVPLPTSTWMRLRNQFLQPKPTGWVPAAPLLYGTIALNLGLIMILPYAAGTFAFSNIVFLARASTFLPIFLPKLVPVHWGRIQQHPHGAYESVTKLFRFLSAASFALHMKTSIVALLSSQPNSHYHRHSALFPWDVEERSRWERSTSALGKVLGSTFEHPVVASVGWDVIQCALSLGFWAAARGINARDMMICSIPGYSASPSNFEWTSREKGSLRNDVLNFLEPGDAELNPESEHNNDMRLRAPRRTGSNTSESGASDEVQATTPTPSKRSRGRPRKTKQQPNADDTDAETPPQHRTTRRSRPKQTEEDADYKPTPATAKLALEGDESPPEDPDWESGSLAWGLAIFGGLATACAGVFGGEYVSR